MNRPTRVLLLVENNSYPQDFRVRREATALHEAGYEVSVIAPHDAGQRWTERIDAVDVYRFPAPPGGSGVVSYALEFGYATFAMLVLACWVAMRKGVDVVHAANPPDTLFVIGALFKLFGKRYVFDHHDLAPEVYLSRFAKPRKNFIYRCLALLERCSYAVADVVIATNESYRQRAIDQGRKRPDKVFVVRNGPPATYQALAPDPELLARAAHLIGYVGTIGPQDGLDYWLRAIRRMVFDLGRRDFLAIIIGDGDAYASVRALARELQIQDFVHFTGRLSEYDSRRYLSAVKVCVQPDPSSPLNDRSTMNKLMEYMALGKPTVAFDLLETRVSARDAALYAHPNDETDFANRVVWLLDHPDACAAMGDCGRSRVAAALLWEHSISNLLEAYSNGLGCAPAARQWPGSRPGDNESSAAPESPSP